MGSDAPIAQSNDMLLESYINEPSELISLPHVLSIFNTTRGRLRRPVKHPSYVVPEPKRAKKTKSQSQDIPFAVSDSCLTKANRAGRSRIFDQDGCIVAVPNAVTDVCPDLNDERNELTVIEMKGPGNERSWLEDETVKSILIKDVEADVLVSRLEVQKYIAKKVVFSLPGKNTRREIYKVFAPFTHKNDMLACLVPSFDILSVCKQKKYITE